MKIVVLSSHTSSLFWFRMDMMKEFINLGHTVTAVGPEPENVWGNDFLKNGIYYKQIWVERNGINPLNDLRTYRDLRDLLKKEKPDKIFSYQAKTIVYGSMAAKANKIKEYYSLIAGLGSVFRGNGLKNGLIKTIMKVEYRAACRASRKVFFQNKDDLEIFVDNNIIDERKAVIINGSGVNLDNFKPVPLPENPVFLFIGRLIKDKGVIEYLESCRIIKKKYSQTRCLIVGPYDSNPSSIKPELLTAYIDQGIVEYYGEQRDVRPFIAQCSTYVLPSYHEGIPKTVLEAMAMGRPIITSNAPGCRETVIDGHNGYLVAVRKVDSLVDRMELLIKDPKKNKIMGDRSLKIAQEKFDVKLINKSIMKTMKINQS